jgi:hypothetical protein
MTIFLFRIVLRLRLSLLFLLLTLALSVSNHPARADADEAQSKPLATPTDGNRNTLNSHGHLLGIVSADHGGTSLPLPGASVYLRGAGIASRDGVATKTDIDGHFKMASPPPGSYQTCAFAPGFKEQCDATPITIAEDSFQLYREVHIVPDGAAVHGRVILADGRPCFQQTTAFRTLVSAKVEVANSSVRLPTVVANRRGQYIIGGLPGTGSFNFSATCDGAHQTRERRIDAADLAGTTSVDLTIENHAPVIRSVFLSDGNGTPVRLPQPGQTLRATVAAVDADGDLLHYRWTDGTWTFNDVDAATVTWTLPDTPGRYYLNVEVRDGRGGFAVDQLTVGTGMSENRFRGVVRDAVKRTPLPKARLTVDGNPATIDDEGNLRLDVREAERHVLNVTAPGYPLMSKIYHGAAPDEIHSLSPATRVTVDPTTSIDLIEKGIRLLIPASALVDDQGEPPRSPLHIDIYSYDVAVGELPGDLAGRGSDGGEISFHGLRGFSIAAFDDAGHRYNLSPGKTATISFPEPRGIKPDVLPSSFNLARYDEVGGVWEVKGEVTRTHGRYEGTVTSFSVWSVGIGSPNSACIHVRVDPYGLDRPFGLTVTIPAPPPPATEFDTVLRYIITDTDNVITQLPPQQLAYLDITPPDSPRPIATYTIVTGPDVSPPIPAFPYLTCGGQITLSSPLPANDWLTRFGPPDDPPDQDSVAYYNSINAYSEAPTFAQWLAVNGFTDADAANEVVFYNPNEIGLGRRLNCTGNIPHTACYVTKYGHPGGSPQEAFDETVSNVSPGDTVAMVRGTDMKFYVYRPDGSLATNTVFDPSGPKYVPYACLHCHGSALYDYYGYHSFPYGNFVVLDPQAYRYPGARKSDASSLDLQQEKFRRINRLLSFGHPADSPYTKLLQSIYPGQNGLGVYIPGTKAIDSPVPMLWSGLPAIWHDVVKPSCRTCHMWQDVLSFDSPGLILTGIATGDICVGDMPNAFNPMLRLWKSTHPNLVQLFLDETGTGNFCGRMAVGGSPPVINITSPRDLDTVSYGGFNLAQFTAQVSDAQDGPNCCNVVWSSDVDGRLGVGSFLQYQFGSPGDRVITATATDNEGLLAQATRRLHVVAVPPRVAITEPTEADVTLFRNVAENFIGSVLSPNDLAMGCESLKWASDNHWDKGFPANGC